MFERTDLAADVWKEYSLFVRSCSYWRVKARPADRTVGTDGQRRAFTPAVILFIALAELKDNSEPG
jgi:hypothetical protein